MNCYEHNTKTAIGQCACCFKGLCKDCVCIKDDILACKNKRCKTIISENAEILLRTKRMYGIGGKNSKQKMPVTALFFMMFGVVFAISSLYRLVQGDSFDIFDASSLGIGCLFFIWGLYRFLQKDKLYI